MRLAGTTVAALVAATVVAAGLHAGAARAAGLGPGCNPDRPAVAHRAGARIVQQAPARIPCGTETGRYTGETGIGVTRSGTVWFSAADWEWALTRSDDNGAHWERTLIEGPQAYPGCMFGTSALTPACSDSQQSKYNTVGDAFLLVDRDTSRVFWSKTYGEAFCSSMNYTDDGELWHPVTDFACGGGDYGKMASGPPPAGGAQPSGFQNVVYECVNAPLPWWVVGPTRSCYKSLDGGANWNLAGTPVVPSPLAPGCLHFQEPQVVGRDGTIYLPLGCGSNGVKVAISHDEAATWSYVTVPIGTAGSSAALIGGVGVSVAVDDAGNLYVVWPGADSRVYLAVSTDQGLTWNAPLMVGAPGVTEGSPRAQIAAREPGHIAIAYYGYTTSSSTLNGYITESFNATAADPLFYSASVNEPSDPLYFPTSSGTLPRNDYLGVTIGPDGTPWAAFVKLESATPDSDGFIQSTGFAGRLADIAQKPDVTVASVTPPASATEGDEVKLGATVRNSGPGNAEDVVVRFLVDGAEIGGERTVASLAAGASASVTSDAWVATPGSHKLTVVVDPSHVLAETDDSNNSSAASFDVAPSTKPIYGPGCDPDRPAVAYRAGGEVVAHGPVRVPCGTETGFYTGETGIGVTGSGTVWFSAADWEWALVRTRDSGRHWGRVIVPGPQAYPGCGVGVSAFTPCGDSEQEKYNTVGDAFLLVDRDSSRVFWSKTYGYAVCSSMNDSDDGELWHPVTSFACPGGDYGKMASGPPPAGGAQPSGYPNVVYECVNGPAPTFVVGPARVCYKSLDGGASWSIAGQPVVPAPAALGCLHFQEPQVVGRDGTVYMPLGCGSSSVMVAISHDEASSWSYVSVPLGGVGSSAGLIGGVSVAVDDAGNLYVVWPGSDNRPYLAVSQDGGQTWHGPLQAGAPGVTLAHPWPQIAAREPGHIAIAFYGYTASASTLNGYVTESFDATAGDPLFYSSAVNDPAKPLYFPTSSGTLPRNDYLGVAIGPDGTPWAAFVKLKSTTPDSQGYIQSTGFAGHLADAQNRPPVAVADAATVASGGTVTVDTLANDSDPDGDALSIKSFSQGASGTVSENGDRTLRYVQDGAAATSDTFTYTVSDGRGGVDTAAVTVAIVQPSSGTATTGGGRLATTDGGKVGFGFNVDEAASGPEGTLELYDAGAGVTIELASVTALGNVSSPCGSVPSGSASLQFRGSGTFNELPASFRVCVQDNREPGAGADRFYLECTRGCTYATSGRVADDVIDGGNVQVRRP